MFAYHSVSLIVRSSLIVRTQKNACLSRVPGRMTRKSSCGELAVETTEKQ